MIVRFWNNLQRAPWVEYEDRYIKVGHSLQTSKFPTQNITQSPSFCCFQRACNKSKAERPPTTDQNSFTSPVGQLRNIDLQVASRTEADSVLPRYRGRGRFLKLPLAASCQSRNRSSKLGFTGFTVQRDSHLQSSKHGQRIWLTLANELLHLMTRRSFWSFSSYFWRSRHGTAVQPLLYSMQFLRLFSWIINRSVCLRLGFQSQISGSMLSFSFLPIELKFVILCMFRIELIS